MASYAVQLRLDGKARVYRGSHTVAVVDDPERAWERIRDMSERWEVYRQALEKMLSRALELDYITSWAHNGERWLVYGRSKSGLEQLRGDIEAMRGYKTSLDYSKYGLCLDVTVKETAI